jgi:hypothetical protein
MEIDEIKSIWSDMNARLEKNESLNKKILNEIMDNRHQTAKEKLMKYEVRYLILSVVFSLITPLYYFSGIFSLVGCLLFAGLFVVAAFWQVYKIVLLREMKMDVVSTTELLQKSLKFKIIKVQNHYTVANHYRLIVNDSVFCRVLDGQSPINKAGNYGRNGCWTGCGINYRLDRLFQKSKRHRQTDQLL